MKIDQLVFVGLNGYALALHRDTGEIVWSNDDLKSPCCWTATGSLSPLAATCSASTR